MDKKFTYFAFISYSHRDSRWATWVQRGLEAYRLPSSVRKNFGASLPKKIFPVFRDATDLSTGRLTDNLHRELDDSQFLIVICSPNAAKPNAEGKSYVNDEVAYFRRNRGTEYVIPVIVEGTPAESFCEELKEADLLALDATKVRKERLLNDIVARILNLRPDELWRREERRMRAKRLRRALIVFFVSLLLSGIGLYWCDSRRECVRYYDDCVDEYGVPKGLWELTRAEVSHRGSSYRFVFKGYSLNQSGMMDDEVRPPFLGLLGVRRVLRAVSVVNSRGIPIGIDSVVENEDQCPMQEFAYDNMGRLRAVRRSDNTGKELGRLNYYNDDRGCQNCVVKFGGISSLKAGFYGREFRDRSDDALSRQAKSSIAQKLLTRDEKGRILTERFFDVFGAPTADAEGCYGLDYELDQFGRRIQWWYVNKEGKRHAIGNSVAGCKMKYEKRNVIQLEYFDDSGMPILGRYGWCRRDDDFDQYGNHVKSVYRGPDGRIMYDSSGAAGFERVWNEHGDLTLTFCLNANEAHSADLNQIGGVCSKYDDQGRVIESCKFDFKHEILIQHDCQASLRFVYDDCGRVVKEQRLDINGDLISSDELAAEIEKGYSKEGYQISVRNFDAKHQLWADKFGIAGWNCEYDKDGNCLRQVFIGRNGGPCVDNIKGYAEARYEYDARGNMTLFAVFDALSKPTRHRDGYSYVEIRFDDRGREIGRKWFDVDRKPIISFANAEQGMAGGFAASVYGYDERGNRISVRYYDEHGALLKPPAKSAGWNSEYDEHGREIRREYIGPDGVVSGVFTSGVCIFESGYDAYGHCIINRMLDRNRKLMMYAPLKCAEIKYVYDNRGNQLSTSCYDTNGHLVVSSKGYAKMEVDFDVYGREIRNSYFGADGHLMCIDKGCAVIESGYNNRGQLCTARFFDELRNPIMASFDPGCPKAAFVNLQYDELGKCIGVDLYDVKGEKVAVPRKDDSK